eukprot:gene9050-18741_t
MNIIFTGNINKNIEKDLILHVMVSPIALTYSSEDSSYSHQEDLLEALLNSHHRRHLNSIYSIDLMNFFAFVIVTLVFPVFESASKSRCSAQDFSYGKWVPGSKRCGLKDQYKHHLEERAGYRGPTGNDIVSVWPWAQWCWKPYNCTPQIFSPKRYCKLMEGHNILFIGDSISYMMYQALYMQLDEPGQPMDQFTYIHNNTGVCKNTSRLGDQYNVNAFKNLLNATILDVVPMTSLRPDGHRVIYNNDCLHYFLPSVVDSWVKTLGIASTQSNNLWPSNILGQ